MAEKEIAATRRIIKVLQVDLAQDLENLMVDPRYNCYRILVLIDKKPLGWVTLTVGPGNSYIGYDEVMSAVRSELKLPLVELSILNRIRASHRVSDAGPISIVVCTRDRTALLASCLNVLTVLNYPVFEIIVVDNAPSSDDTFELVKKFPVRYVRENTPGLDWARNRGIQEANYPIVAFTDDDAHPNQHWLWIINESFTNPRVMALTGYVGPAELEHPAQEIFEIGYGGMGHGFRQRYIRKATSTDQQLLWASSFGVGANMAFRKTVFQQVGDFDTGLDVGTPSSGGGDIEMFHRIVLNDHLLLYEPSMIVWHYHRSTDQALRKQVYNNGRSFGCYLIDCYIKRTVRRPSIVRFFLVNWLYKWNIRNLLKRGDTIPRSLSLTELQGMLTSPWAYRKTRLMQRETVAKSKEN
ncbi:glycosyltransferase [Segetibacter sp. 3557_3]|uniref:glycosyltransferase n=1 Tax=Segetibacter sp. 3557_3 TaxID=2547429 RepID=UPI001058A93C|nr:glycosyltransferase [Segetibacter sp. 3557_3]TDH20816.1 glycosyltransferase [Segetibacter sp. 3557_3]